MKDVGNLAATFKNNGYSTLAIHPENPNNWGRTEVYRDFGFEEFLSIDDFEDVRYIRNHVSDESCYEMIIDKFKELTNPGFIFAVTMQNHGGYDLDSIGELEKINIEDKYAQYSDVITYLSLLKESDNALLTLLNYFRSVRKPVILCIFGDHQASLDANFIQEIYGKKLEDCTLEEFEQSYAVPYMIWTNKDVNEPVEMDMSANYLGQVLLELSGINNTAYSKYLIDLMEKIEVINRYGYRVDGEWYAFEEVTPYTKYIDEYLQIQYNALFDKTREKSYYIPRL
jgi:phosphoglycerol transferase MdoB-like AlkP superfamily enzyme